MKYDFLIVGAGLFGATFAHEAKKDGKRCLVIDKRDHIGGNTHCTLVNGIWRHDYGAHIFHTNDLMLWNYVNQFTRFNRFKNSPIARNNGKVYNLPFNMNTFSQVFGCTEPIEAAHILNEERLPYYNNQEPKNLEEQALRLVGPTLYELIIKHYTEKQWGRPCSELPPFIIKRLPVRFTYDNSYFDDAYQGVPINGYNEMVHNMLLDIQVELMTPYEQRDFVHAKKLVYTGPLDQYFNYCHGHLEYRSLQFDHTELKGMTNAQGNAVVNHTSDEFLFTRTIEHKHFYDNRTEYVDTVLTHEYPVKWEPGLEPYYPVNDAKNQALFAKYKAMGEAEKDVIFGGRLAEYRYYDMHQVIASAISAYKKIGST